MSNVFLSSLSGMALIISIAASSCRLSRTMMQLGQAAGTAALLAMDKSDNFINIDVGGLKA